MAEKAKKGEMTMLILLPMYTAQWEMKAARKEQRQVEAQQSRLADLLWSASESRQPKEQSRPEKSALRRLLISLGRTGA
jgi:hypothetical protein